MKKHLENSVEFTAPTPMWGHRSPLRLAVVGVGALGSELCLQIDEALRGNLSAMRATAEVFAIDPDRLEPRNLGLTRLFRPSGAGRFKADLVAERLNTSGDLRWTALPHEIADVGWQILRDCRLLISCVDSALARSEIALVARMLHLPMLDGGVSAQDAPRGRVAWFPPASQAACYLCGMGEARRAEILAYGFSRTLGCSAPPNADPLSDSLAAAPAVRETAAALVRALLDLLDRGQTGFLDPRQAGAERLTGHHLAGRPWTTERLSLPRGVACPWHQDSSDPLIPVEEGQTFREAIRHHAGAGSSWRVQLAWPVCLEARCRTCGLRQECTMRLAKLRRRGRCAGCGLLASLDALRCLASIGSDDPEAGKTPLQLGLPDRHLYRLRRTIAVAGVEANRT